MSTDFVAFFSEEFGPESPRDNHATAASRLNLVAGALADDARIRDELLPAVEAAVALCARDGDFAALLGFLSALGEHRRRFDVARVAPKAVLRVVLRHLAAHPELAVREAAEAVIGVVVSLADAREVRDVFEEEVREQLGELQGEYLRAVAGIRFVAMANAVLGEGDRIVVEEEVMMKIAARHSSPSVRCAVASQFTALGATESVGDILLDSECEAVLIAVCTSSCLVSILSMKKRKSDAEWMRVARKLLLHDSWRVRLESIRSISEWDYILMDPSGAKNFMTLAESRLRDPEMVVKREACVALSKFVHSDAQVGSSVIEAIESTQQQTDHDTIACLERARLNLFKNGLITLKEIIGRLDVQRDPTIHLQLTQNIMNVQFLRTIKGIKSEEAMTELIREMYISLINSSSNVHKHGMYSTCDVTIWKSLVFTLETCPQLLREFFYTDCGKVWQVECDGNRFLYECINHPCAAVSKAFVRVLPELLQVFHTNVDTTWTKHSLLPYIIDLSKKTLAPNVQSPLLSISAILLQQFKDVDDIDVLDLVELVSLNGIKCSSPAIRGKASKIIVVLGKRLPHKRDSLSNVIRDALSKDLDYTTRKELERGLAQLSTV